MEGRVKLFWFTAGLVAATLAAALIEQRPVAADDVRPGMKLRQLPFSLVMLGN